MRIAMSDKPACGPLVELVKTDGVRVARCPCGNMHVTFAQNGLTVQLAPEYYSEVTQALSLAKSIAEGARTSVGAPSVVQAGSFVTINVGDRKKPAN